MSPRITDRELSAEQFDRALDSILEEAFLSDDWRLLARAIQVGVEDEASRIATCCRVGEIIMRRLFVLRESDTTVRQFLVEQLGFDPEKGRVFALMAIESAKRAVEVRNEGRSLDDVIHELTKEQGAEPELARPMVETGIRFLERWTPKRGFVLLALLGLLCNAVVAAPLALTLWLGLLFGQEQHWVPATLAAIALFSLLRGVGHVVDRRVQATIGGRPHRGKPPPAGQ